MKKLFALILVLCLALSFAACDSDKDTEKATSTDASATSGTPAKEPETIAELFEAGFVTDQSGFSETEAKILFVKSGVYVVASAKIDAVKFEEYNNIDVSDENYDSLIMDFYNSLENVKLTDVSDRVPTQAELDALIGKTLGELEEAGFEQNSYFLDEYETRFVYSNDVYSCELIVTGYDADTDPDDLSPNDIKAFVVKSAVFEGFSWSFLDGEF